MLEVFQNFEQLAVRLKPIVLIGPGLATVLLGLFVWLGGLGFRKILVAVIGALGGGVCGFFITDRNVMFAMILAAAAAVIAIALEKILVTGSLFWHLASALCCAALGTMLIFAGMILLLLYKGAAPISRICGKQPFYTTVFIAMTAFGTTEQLLLCQRAKKRPTAKKQTNQGKEKTG
jgi:hypothetical protein